jgi:hypothetical protein
MNEPNFFEEMLATYPAEKRELAREVYHRFADGDSTQFFTQLLLVLDVYARYVERIPKAAVEANQDSFAILQDAREEIGMIAKTIEARDLNITNSAVKTDELCKITQAKCNETIASVELMVKNLGSQVDTKAIIQKIEDAIKSIILPLQIRADKLSNTIEPTFEKLNAASERAAQLWPQRIWKTALTAGVIVGLSVAILGISAAYWQMKRHFDKTLADEIRAEKYTLKNNMEAFQQLATAAAPVYVARASDSNGVPIPSGYCLYIPNAQGADMKDGNGRIFFVSSRPEAELKQLLDVQQQQ